MNAKMLASLFGFMMIVAVEAGAQPTCFVSYPISLDCPNIDGDVVFLGRVISLGTIDGQTRELDQLIGYPLGKAVVAVQELFKGEANGVLELTLRGSCYGRIEKGKRYIFNLSGSPENYYPRWSGELEYLSEGDAAKLLDAIRARFRGERQPRLFGTLYNVTRHAPINSVTIVAEKDRAKYESYTDSLGNYEFRELPEGEYKVYPMLPPSMVLGEGDNRTQSAERNDLVRVSGDTACGTRRNFTALDTGVISGSLEQAESKPVVCLGVYLRRFADESVSEFKEIIEPEGANFSFDHLPPGHYLIEIAIFDDDRHVTTGFYYPAASNQKDATVIRLDEGQKVTGLVIKLARPKWR